MLRAVCQFYLLLILMLANINFSTINGFYILMHKNCCLISVANRLFSQL